MGFWIAKALSDGTKDGTTEVLLSPGPSSIEYPPGAVGRLVEAGGTVVMQQPTRDNRLHTWVWSGWPADHPDYQALWAILEPLRSRYRLMDGESPYVYVKEDESTQLRTVTLASTSVTPAYPWLKARVLDVTRTRRTGGSSLLVYERTILSFVLEDAAVNDLG